MYKNDFLAMELITQVAIHYANTLAETAADLSAGLERMAEEINALKEKAEAEETNKEANNK